VVMTLLPGDLIATGTPAGGRVPAARGQDRGPHRGIGSLTQSRDPALAVIRP
jgi:2-keto-4-pentenoate hydratase/2-oxohepta-3-ene-1,7-dioic acid hydratase in catechol pathway